ncbi:MAG: FAD:protein FMN transferase, partial [Candidatus Thermoplasmatota archaeon]|nr:FAD:protein FMN transferase [Candidatus Thermoplasmatota archaeon]
ELKNMIETCIYYYDITGGAFDITILPLLNLWSNDKYLFSMNSTYAFDLDNNTVSNEIKSGFENFEPSLYDLNETPALSLVDGGWEIKSSWQTYYLTNETNEIKVYTKFWYLPSTTQDVFINEIKELVGSNKITIADDSISLETGMSITLDGMAKGYAVDEAVKVLKAHGIAAGLVDAGGDIATFGMKPGNEKWITGLRNPQDTSESVMEFGLSDMAIATSGNYERYFDKNATVGHIMDPANGRSVSKCSSATVITKNCTIADILATSVFVKGTVDGIDLANSLANVEAVVLGYDDPQETFTSSGLENFVIEN